jgi:predicted nicotinamide N-methyase
VGRRVPHRPAAVAVAPPLTVEAVVESVDLGDGRPPLRIWRPAASEPLIDDERFAAHDEFLPYWAELWPSAITLARRLARDDAVAGRRVLEVGCGLGLPALAAARAGADVVATDWAAEAVAATTGNAQANALTVRALIGDWRDPAPLVALGPFDLVVAADVLYEERHADPLLTLLAALQAPRILLADPSRTTATAFLEQIDATHDRTTSTDPDRASLLLHELRPR